MTFEPRPEPSEIRRLIAEGAEVTFADGSSSRIHYGARALAKIEDQYGSLDNFLTELGKASAGKVFHLLAFSFSVALGMPQEKIWDLIDTHRAVDYVTAVSVAVAEALPGSSPEDRKAAANGQASDSKNDLAAPGPSPGAVTTTLPSSVGESTPSASGT